MPSVAVRWLHISFPIAGVGHYRPTVRVSQLDYADRQVKGQSLGITHYYKFVMTFSLRSLGRNYRPGLQVSDAVGLSFRPPT
jgi:hypothetical protein